MEARSAWLRRVGLNLANSWWRRRFAERRALTLAAVTGPSAGDDAEPADAIAVRAAVAALPRRQRTAVALRYFVGLSVAETAVEMQCAEGTVKSLTSQGVTALRRALGEDTPVEVEEHA